MRGQAPEGSPTRPVAPPSSAMGRCPQRWNHVSTTMPSRWPRCRLSAVGSKPKYTDSLLVLAACSSASLVVSCMRPRARSRWMMLPDVAASSAAGGASAASVLGNAAAAEAALQHLTCLHDRRGKHACCLLERGMGPWLWIAAAAKSCCVTEGVLNILHAPSVRLLHLWQDWRASASRRAPGMGHLRCSSITGRPSACQ